ncbi:MAG: hypothetical protein K6E42_08870 [Synergistes sp.]|nr:hypothetical protein [Synergistes sp.]
MREAIAELATQIVVTAIDKGTAGTRSLNDICNFYRTIYRCIADSDTQTPQG